MIAIYQAVAEVFWDLQLWRRGGEPQRPEVEHKPPASCKLKETRYGTPAGRVWAVDLPASLLAFGAISKALPELFRGLSGPPLQAAHRSVASHYRTLYRSPQLATVTNPPYPLH